MKKRIFIMAGEDSGDVLGAGLMRELKQKTNVEFWGIGGDMMKQEGLHKIIFPMEELSVMGLDILPKLHTIRGRIKETVEEILEESPDMVISIDAPEFSFRVLKKVRAKNPNIKLVHYVSPSVWAWREGRAKKISKFLNGLLLLWPFEDKYYPDIKTFYVGHSATTRFKPQREIKTNKILCLPGSRKKEIKKLFPIFITAINNIHKKDKNISVEVPVAYHVREQVETMSEKINAKTRLIYSVPEKEKLNGKVALCASGTAVFELALKDVPTIAVYKMSPVAGLIGKMMLKTKWVTLPNIIMQKTVVPEFLQKECNVENVQKYLEDMLYKPTEIARQRKCFKKMREKLQAGEINPDVEAANAIHSML